MNINKVARRVAAAAAAVVVAGSIVAVPTASQAASLNVQNVTLNWDESSFYFPDGCGRYNFDYANNIGFRLLRIEAQITDQYGTLVDWDSEIGVDNGVFGRWTMQICDWELKSGNGPYNVQFSIEDYDGSSRFQTMPLTFLSRPAPTPTASVPTASEITTTTSTTTTTVTKVKVSKKSSVSITAKRSAGKTTVTGKVKVAGKTKSGVKVQLQRKLYGSWVTAKTVRSKAGGKVVVTQKVSKGEKWRLYVPATATIKKSVSKTVKK
jgi:5-hydroxyisourate hydrolase-like protein (transthyretin family)